MRRYDPDGALVEAVARARDVPDVSRFGGADLSTLFVTTSRHRLSDAQRAEQPLAGALLVVDAGVRGRARQPRRPPPSPPLIGGPA